jgi:SAM-dependent methyltransferase
MSQDFDPVAFNRVAWDKQVDSGNEWTRPVSAEVIAAARRGEFSVVLIGYQPVDRQWLPADLSGVDILCLASGGGQQAPTLSAAGANVTVLDNSPRQLEQDAMVAQRDGLTLRTILGDMRDLSAFADESFDVVFHPVSNLFSPELTAVWRECFRVLRPGGSLLSGFVNPDVFIFDDDALDRGELIVRHSIPRDTADSPGEWPIAYSHTMTEQIGGQLAAGFLLTGFSEAPHHQDATAAYLPGYFATRAVRP